MYSKEAARADQDIFCDFKLKWCTWFILGPFGATMAVVAAAIAG